MVFLKIKSIKINREEFINYIELIGFKYNHDSYFYECKEFKIDLWYKKYDFYNGSEWSEHYYTDLRPIEMYFKRELRSIKIKKILK